MVRKILVPLDGSPLAERAIPIAAALAGVTGSTIRLIRAVRTRRLPGVDATDDELAEMAAAEAYLDARATELARQGGAAETSAVFAPPTAAILEEAGQADAGMIVMATHGRGQLGRWIMGSTARAVLRAAPVPVLLVRAWHAHRAVERIGPGARIVVPLDGSNTAEGALPVAERLAATLHGQLVLVQAVPPTDPALTPDGMAVALFHEEAGARLVAARAYLEQVAGRLGPTASPAAREARIGDAAATIDAIARERGAALVVMVTHGRTGFDRVLLGSVAEALVRAGSTPLLLVRAGHEAPGLADARPARPQRDEDRPLPAPPAGHQSAR